MAIHFLCILAVGLASIIPDAQAQTYDNYAWYGYSGQGDWTAGAVGSTRIWNSTDSANWIGHNGYAIQYSTYSGTVATYPTYKLYLKLARNGTIANEFNIYFKDPTGRPIVNTRANYTLATPEPVQAGDYIGWYSNGGNPQLFKNTAPNDESTIYKAGDVTGSQVFSNKFVSPEETCIQVLVGWNDPAEPVIDWGNYVYHGLGFFGLGLLGYGGVALAYNLHNRQWNESGYTFMIFLICLIVGAGLVYGWLTT